MALVGAGALALAVAGPAAVLALVNDSGDLDLRVANRQGYQYGITAAGAYVEYIGDQNQTFGPSGTGTFDSFVRVQASPTEQGYNTNGTLEFDTKGGTWTHAIKVSDIPVVLVNGKPSWELFADINESNSTPLISLNDMEVYFTSNPNLTGYPFGVNATKVYDFEGAVRINDVNQGSGRGDLRYSIPLDDIEVPLTCGYKDPDCNTWFVLYNRWGTTSGYSSDGGFEEWKVKQYPYVVVNKTATTSYTRTYEWDITKSVDEPTTQNIPAGSQATFNYDVQVSHNNGTDSDFAVAGSITITNPGRDAAIISSVADVLSDGTGATVSCPVSFPYTLARNGTLTCTYSAGLNDATSLMNTATVTLSYGGVFTDKAPVVFNGPTTVVDECIEVTDDLYGTLGTVCAGVDPNPKTFSYSMSFDGVAGTCTDYPNVASFVTNDTRATDSDTETVEVCVGSDLTVSKTAAGTFDREYLWDIAKDVDKTKVTIAEGDSATFNYTVDVWQTGILDSGWELSGVITVSNPNDWQAITLTAVSDVVNNGGTCTVAAGPHVIPASGSKDIAYSCSYAAAPSSYSGTNTATVMWDKTAAATPSGSASGSKDFTLTQDQSTNKTVDVTDSYAGTLGSVTATDAAPFASKSFEYSRTESGVAGTCVEYANTATITQTGDSDDADVELCVAKDLTVEKDADPTFTRTWTWDITKDVDASSATIDQGGTATFNYTVSVSHDSGTDSAWKVEGTIHVANPNDFQDITLTSLTDTIDNGGVCTLAEAGPFVVGKGSSIHVDYTCTYASAPNPLSGTNTATASWDKSAYMTPNGTASGTATADFDTEPTTKVDECIDVTDTMAGSLGTVCVGDANPTTFTYSKSFSPIACGTFDYDNTASFLTNDTDATGSDSETVTVTVLCNEGCTPGYWKNHPEDWVGYATNQTLESVFDVPDAFGYDNVTLMDALSFQGGSDDAGAAQILLRAGVAALLNASSPSISYPLTEAQIISQVNTALAGSRSDMLTLARMLDDYNNAGCYF